MKQIKQEDKISAIPDLVAIQEYFFHLFFSFPWEKRNIK
jgi:hypothetical protein